MKNGIFISHSSENKEIAEQLCNYLVAIGVNKDQIFCSSILGQGVKNGEKLNDRIEESLRNSKLLLFVLSYEFLKSSYCIEELGVGWFLSENKTAKCYYLVLPDIFSLSEIQGFVNSKIDKFSRMNDRGELGQFADNLCEDLEIQKPSDSYITNAIDIFVSNTNMLFNSIIERRKQIESDIKNKENELTNLKAINKTLEVTSNTLRQQLANTKDQNELNLLVKEYHTIEHVCGGLSTQLGVSKEKYEYIGEYFWFNIINRYLKIREKLKKYDYRPIFSGMDMTIATVYSAYGDYDKAYKFLINSILITRGTIYPDVFRNIIFTKDNDTHELIEIMEKKLKETDEGLIQKSYKMTLQYLLDRKEKIKIETGSNA